MLEFILSHADSFKTSHFASYSVNKCWEFTQWAAPADILTSSPLPGLTDSVGPRLWDLVRRPRSQGTLSPFVPVTLLPLQRDCHPDLIGPLQTQNSIKQINR